MSVTVHLLHFRKRKVFSRGVVVYRAVPRVRNAELGLPRTAPNSHNLDIFRIQLIGRYGHVVHFG